MIHSIFFTADSASARCFLPIRAIQRLLPRLIEYDTHGALRVHRTMLATLAHSSKADHFNLHRDELVVFLFRHDIHHSPLVHAPGQDGQIRL